MTNRFTSTSALIFAALLALTSCAYSIKFKSHIEVKPNNCSNEECFKFINNDRFNSPLVKCSLLPEQFYSCATIDKNATNCTRWQATKHGDVQTTNVVCFVFDGIECRGNRSFEITVPCIIYTDKYFVSTIIYSVFLGIFAVDRCCIGHTGIGIGKLITFGGFGIWYMIDIILLVVGVIKPSDNSNWIPYF